MTEQKSTSRMSLRELNGLFHTALDAAQNRVANATGETPQEAKYAQADMVRIGYRNGYVDLTFQGRVYPAVLVSMGAIDGDKSKSTGLIKTDEGVWYKLWFFDNDIQK